ncbi:MAG: DUF4174 domain-containing protein [Pseudomonadota bacterium]
MKKLALLAALAAIPTAGSAETAIAAWQEDPTRVFATEEVVLDDLQWQLRALVVFGRGDNDPLFLEQMDLIAARADDLAVRDVIVVTDTDPDTLSELRKTLRPRSFMLALIGKDGRVAFRKPAPWDVREISRSIDKMPLRQQEIANRRGTDG